MVKAKRTHLMLIGKHLPRSPRPVRRPATSFGIRRCTVHFYRGPKGQQYRVSAEIVRTSPCFVWIQLYRDDSIIKKKKTLVFDHTEYEKPEDEFLCQYGRCRTCLGEGFYGDDCECDDPEAWIEGPEAWIERLCTLNEDGTVNSENEDDETDNSETDPKDYPDRGRCTNCDEWGPKASFCTSCEDMAQLYL